MIFQTKKFIEENKDKIKEEDKKEIETKIESLEKVKDSKDIEPIKKAIEEMEQVVQKIGAQMYSEASKNTSADQTDKKKEDASEADFEEVDKDKK